MQSITEVSAFGGDSISALLNTRCGKLSWGISSRLRRPAAGTQGEERVDALARVPNASYRIAELTVRQFPFGSCDAHAVAVDLQDLCPLLGGRR